MQYAEKCKTTVGFKSIKGEVIGILSALEGELIKRISNGISLNTVENLTDAEEQYSKELARMGGKSLEEDFSTDDEEIEKILANPEFNKLIKSLGIA